MIKLGVFGGRRGQFAIEWCQKTKLAEIVAVCERDENVIKEIQKKYPDANIIFDNDFDKFLSRDVDAIFLANCAHQHATYAIKSLNAKKHVLSEVLPCQTLAEAVALCEAVENSGKIYAYAENYCFMPATMEMRRLYESGKLGTLEYAEGEYVHNCEPIWHSITYGERNHWRNRIMHSNFYCTHSLGPIIYITGLKPVSVVGFELPFNDRCARMGKRSGSAGIEMVTLENGAVIRSLHGDLDKDSIRFILYGSKGRAESAPYDVKMDGIERIFTNLDKEEGVYEDNPVNYVPEDEWSKNAKNIGHGGSDYYVLRNFINAVEGKKAQIIDIYKALDMFLPGLFAYFSVLNKNERMSIPDFRNKNEREQYRNDNRCTDYKVAKDKVLPSYSKCTINIPDEIYSKIKERYEDSLKEE